MNEEESKKSILEVSCDTCYYEHRDTFNTCSTYPDCFDNPLNPYSHWVNNIIGN